MKIFGTIFPFVEPNDENFRMGRFIANYEFLVALLTYSDFDSFHLFCMNPQHFQETAERLTTDAKISADAKSKIQLFLYSSLREKLETEQYHVFHLGGWGYFFSGLADLRARYASSPFPITGVIHSLNARESRFDYYKLLKAPLASYDAVICTSSAGQQVMQKQLQRIATLEQTTPFQGQLPIIPLGTMPQALPESRECRYRLGISRDAVVMLYIGRLSPKTKADLYPLLITCQQLQERSPVPIQLILCGGAAADELTLHREMIDELGLNHLVKLLPNFDPAMKSQLYAAADISVAPADNLQETFGISVIESMHAGLPVVAADINGYRDLIDDEVNGFRIHTTWIDQLELADQDEIMDNDSLQTLLAQCMALDLEQLLARLLELINDPELRQRLGANGQQKAREQYLWSAVIPRYQYLWQALNAQAQNEGIPASGHEGFFSNDFLGSFSHYPTRILRQDMRVSVTESGQRCLQTGRTPPIYSEVALLLDQDWLGKAIEYMASHPEGCTVKDMLDKCGDHQNRGRFSLLWAVKYGLIRLNQA